MRHWRGKDFGFSLDKNPKFLANTTNKTKKDPGNDMWSK